MTKKKTTGKKSTKAETPAPAANSVKPKATKAKPEEKPAVAEKVEKKPAAKPAVKSAAAKGGESPKRKGAAKPQPINGGVGVTVQIGPSKPVLSIAPGVMIRRKPDPVRAAPSDEEGANKPRKLTTKERNEIREMLRSKRDQLLNGMKRELAESRNRSGTKACDEVDQATDAYDEDLSLEIATKNDEELEEIEAALKKIEDGTYGLCEVCSCRISPSRLKILPFATTCVACRGEEERNRKRDDSRGGPWALVNDEAEPDEAE